MMLLPGTSDRDPAEGSPSRGVKPGPESPHGGGGAGSSRPGHPPFHSRARAAARDMITTAVDAPKRELESAARPGTCARARTHRDLALTRPFSLHSAPGSEEEVSGSKPPRDQTELAIQALGWECWVCLTRELAPRPHAYCV